jgi:hypothetical protein
MVPFAKSLAGAVERGQPADVGDQTANVAGDTASVKRARSPSPLRAAGEEVVVKKVKIGEET